MIISTTNSIEGARIVDYKGVVTGEAILGTNIFRDMFAGVRDLIGGRAGGYEKSLREARELAISEMKDEAKRLGADAVIGIDLDYENINAGGSSSMLMVSATGTAVVLGKEGF